MKNESNTRQSLGVRARALVVASDANTRRHVVELLSSGGAQVREAESASAAWTALDREPFDVVVPIGEILDAGGARLISKLREFDAVTAVVAVVDSEESGHRALAEGAYDFFAAPVDADRFAVVLDHVGETLRLRERCSVLDRMMNGGAHIGGLLTRDPRMIAVVDSVKRLARYRTPVLVVGERGTEHEEVARALHGLGRPDGPFIACEAAVMSVAELRDGYKAAAGGTLYIDDLTALAADVSAGLTAILEQSNGASDETNIARIVVGCPQATVPSVDPGDARAELHRRLTTTVLTLPPLRERRGDAVLVARELAAGVGRDRGRELAIARPVEDALLSYTWPGNLDELKAVVVTAAATANGPTIEVRDLPAPLAEHAGSAGPTLATRRLRDLEMQHLRQVLEETHGNKSRAARILGLSRWALQRKLRKHGISLDDPQQPQGEAEA
jgi:DNA-binding NtrC family response regulator